jgi:hypothetical protein
LRSIDMAIELVQFADGSAALQNTADSVNDMHVGGPPNPSGATPRLLVARRMKMALVANDAAAGMVSWQNIAVYPVIVTRAILHVTTIAAAACTVSVGTATTAVLASNLISGQDVHSATGGFFSSTGAVIAAGSFLTASTASGASAGIVGYLYVETMPATL